MTFYIKTRTCITSRVDYGLAFGLLKPHAECTADIHALLKSLAIGDKAGTPNFSVERAS